MIIHRIGSFSQMKKNGTTVMRQILHLHITKVWLGESNKGNYSEKNAPPINFVNLQLHVNMFGKIHYFEWISSLKQNGILVKIQVQSKMAYNVSN